MILKHAEILRAAFLDRVYGEPSDETVVEALRRTLTFVEAVKVLAQQLYSHGDPSFRQVAEELNSLLAAEPTPDAGKVEP